MPHVQVRRGIRLRRWTALLALAAAFLAAPLIAQEEPYPATVRYAGEARAADGKPLEGRFDVQVALFDKSGARLLWQESFAGVEVHQGKFAVVLGGGSFQPVSTYTSLRSVFAAHYQVELELSFGGKTFGPRVGLLPAGHSLETRLILDGKRQPNDARKHWKWYSHRSDVSSFQATILSPQAAGQRRSETASTRSGPFLLEMQGPWLSKAVRDLPVAVEQPADEERQPMDAEPPRIDTKEINPPRHESLVDEFGRPFGTVAPKADDTLVELSRRGAAIAGGTPGPVVNFDGIANPQGFYPPDTEMAVGPNHIVQVVNVSFAIYNKSGSLLAGPVATSTLWSTLLPPTDPCRTRNDGDAIFLYDRQADRWVLTQFAVPGAGQRVCFAVSTTNDPTGTYYLYSLLSQRFPDYFKLGVWPDATNNAYFMGTNSGFQNQYDVYAIDRANLLAGIVPRPAQFFQSFPNLQMPADVDSAAAPPAGSPGILYSFRDGGEPYFGSPPTDSLDIREYAVDWNIPANSTFTLAQSLTPAQGFANFIWSVCGFFVSNCLPQPTTAQGLDSASWWPMQRLVYRNFNGRQSLVGSWTVDTLANGNHAAPRWFELRRGAQTSGNWVIHQQGTHAPDSKHRWMPSIAMDRSGDIALGYSIIDAPSSLFASIRWAARENADPLGTLQSEASVHVGTGAQTGTASRWGDYSAMEIDPTDDCTFWFTTEYLNTTGTAPWRTRIASFTLPDCGDPNFSLDAAPPLKIVCSPNNATFDIDAWYYDGLTGDINLGVTGNPGGTTTGFSVNPLTPGSLTSVLTVSGITSGHAGTHMLTITGTGGGGSIVHSRDVTLVVDGPNAPTLISPANAATVTELQPFFQWSPVVGAVTYTIEIASDAGFTTIVDSATVGVTSHTPAAPLNALAQYWWRVRANNACGSSPNSSVFTFNTPFIFCRNPNVTIPDGPPAGVTDNMVVVAPGTISDLNVSIDATHTWVGDLIFTLKKGVPQATIIDRPGVPASTFGCDADNVDAILDDEGTSGPVETACPPGGGLSFTPNQPLTVFDGQTLAGTWMLTVSDPVTPDGGTLVRWCISPQLNLLNSGFEPGNLSEWAGSYPP